MRRVPQFDDAFQEIFQQDTVKLPNREANLTFDLGFIRTGKYDPRYPLRAGKTFEIVLRDADGLPVVTEAFGGYARLERWRFCGSRGDRERFLSSRERHRVLLLQLSDRQLVRSNQLLLALLVVRPTFVASS